MLYYYKHYFAAFFFLSNFAYLSYASFCAAWYSFLYYSYNFSFFRVLILALYAQSLCQVFDNCLHTAKVGSAKNLICS